VCGIGLVGLGEASRTVLLHGHFRPYLTDCYKRLVLVQLFAPTTKGYLFYLCICSSLRVVLQNARSGWTSHIG
jgi:hypothetical protein